MPFDAVAEEGPPPARRLVIVNATMLDQNFGLLARPGTLDVVPDVGAERILAWRVAFVPGRIEGVTSRGHFLWEERCAVVLGRFARSAGFLPEVRLPLPASGTAVVGFVGAPHNGGAKLLRVEGGSTAASILRTDGTFPPAEARSGTTRHLAFATAIDPEGEGDGAAVAVSLGPNMAASFEPAPRYWITPLAASAAAGDPVPPEIAAAAHPLEFGGGSALHLVFTDRNTFEASP